MIKKIKEYFELVIGSFLVLGWALGGLSGAIIGAVNDNLLDVVLSIFIPGYGLIISIIELVKLILN